MLLITNNTKINNILKEHLGYLYGKNTATITNEENKKTRMLIQKAMRDHRAREQGVTELLKNLLNKLGGKVKV
jgi:hypothetical protein